MAQKRKANAEERNGADKKEIFEEDLDESKTLQQGEWVTLYTETGTRTHAYAPGFGVEDKSRARGFADMDMKDSNSNNISGKLRYSMYRSSDQDDQLYYVRLPSPSELRSANGSNRTEKPVIPQMSPAIGNDRVLALELKVDNSTNDGNTFSSSNSSSELGLPYAEV